MLYAKPFRIYITAAPLLILARILLKTLVIDAGTGFYTGAGVWAALFTLALTASCVMLLWYIHSPFDRGINSLRGNRVMECLAALLGAALLVLSAIALYSTAVTPDAGEVNVFPRWLKITEHLLGCASGISFAALATVLWSGARANSAHGVIALLPPVWHAFYMVERFISFRQPLFASDQLLEILYLCSATMFYLAHARCLSGTEPSRKAALSWSLLTALLGPVLVFGQLSALAVLGRASGPTGPVMALALATSLYALTVAICAAGAKQKSPPAPQEYRTNPDADAAPDPETPQE